MPTSTNYVFPPPPPPIDPPWPCKCGCNESAGEGTGWLKVELTTSGSTTTANKTAEEIYGACPFVVFLGASGNVSFLASCSKSGGYSFVTIYGGNPIELTAANDDDYPSYTAEAGGTVY